MVRREIGGNIFYPKTKLGTKEKLIYSFVSVLYFLKEVVNCQF